MGHRDSSATRTTLGQVGDLLFPGNNQKGRTMDKEIKDMTDREIAEETLAILRTAVGAVEQLAQHPMVANMLMQQQGSNGFAAAMGVRG